MQKMRIVKRSLLIVLISLGISGIASADDWPRWRGPEGDAKCKENGLLQSWPEGGPELLWEVSGLGAGYSSVSISNGKLYTMGDLEVDSENAQRVISVDLATHTILWMRKIGPIHVDDRGGPRCIPTVDGDLVYALGTSGDLACLKTDNGEIVWRKNLIKDFGGKSAQWKYSESPLVDGDKVLCSPGGLDAALVALNKKTGDLFWKAPMPDIVKNGNRDGGYSSFII
ncbi:MAG: PQQ-binding-like beta-propeller repeat protein, partial [Sedimentisphaerales bacterium]